MIEFMEWLEKQILHVGTLEAKAKKLLGAEHKQDYITLMREKAQLLAKLEETSQPMIDSLPSGLQAEAQAALRGFSSSAQMALDLDSVFFMSALLYPDEHKEGEPNTLEVFREHLSSRLGE